MTSLTTEPTALDLLVARGLAFSHFARLLGEDPTPIVEGTTLQELADALSLLGETRALDRLEVLEAVPPRSVDELRLLWVRWFDQGRIAPYECSNKPPTVAGHTGPLADVAGFYRALGMQVSGNRPDHVVAELEFASLATLAEAQALVDGRTDDAEVSADIARTFLRDHLGVWIDAWAVRVLSIEPAVPWGPIAAAAAAFTASEAARRNVIPIRVDAVFDAVPPELADERDEPDCAGDL
jgi:hypothetical protein